MMVKKQFEKKLLDDNPKFTPKITETVFVKRYPTVSVPFKIYPKAFWCMYNIRLDDPSYGISLWIFDYSRQYFSLPHTVHKINRLIVCLFVSVNSSVKWPGRWWSHVQVHRLNGAFSIHIQSGMYAQVQTYATIDDCKHSTKHTTATGWKLPSIWTRLRT